MYLSRIEISRCCISHGRLSFAVVIVVVCYDCIIAQNFLLVMPLFPKIKVSLNQELGKNKLTTKKQPDHHRAAFTVIIFLFLLFLFRYILPDCQIPYGESSIEIDTSAIASDLP